MIRRRIFLTRQNDGSIASVVIDSVTSMEPSMFVGLRLVA
jgi:hypothetical protein